MHKICKNRAGVSQSHHFHNVAIGIGISLSIKTPGGKTLVIGLELLSQALCHGLINLLELIQCPNLHDVSIFLKQYISNVPFPQYNVPFRTVFTVL